MEACFWIVGVYYEPQYCLARRIMKKVLAISSIIDDVYDAYGTIDEIEIFTSAVERSKNYLYPCIFLILSFKIKLK